MTHAGKYDIAEEVVRERIAQDAKWGEQNHPDGTGPKTRVPGAHLYAQELASVARSTCDAAHRAGNGTWADILAEEFFEALAESDPARLRAELIQVAAVATAWAEAIDRRPA